MIVTFGSISTILADSSEIFVPFLDDLIAGLHSYFIRPESGPLPSGTGPFYAA